MLAALRSAADPNIRIIGMNYYVLCWRLRAELFRPRSELRYKCVTHDEQFGSHRIERLFGRDSFEWSPTAELDRVLNNLPGLWFTGVTQNVPELNSAHTLVQWHRSMLRSRVPHARSPVRDAGSASLSSHLDGPLCASPQQDSLCGSALACRSHAAHNTIRVLLADLPHFGLAETDCRLTSGVRTRIVSKETPNPLFSFRGASAEFRERDGSLERAFALLEFCCPARRLFGCSI
jgi:hypothetical protein